jgi:hypothetical protein
MRIRIRDLFDPRYGMWDGKIRIRGKHPLSVTLTLQTIFTLRLP